MSGSRHARTCGGPSIVAATRRNALRDTLPTCRRAALPHALDRDTCPAFISQSSTIVKAASPSIRRTRSPSAGAPPQAGPSRHADRGTRAAFCASLVSSPFPIAACAASISCPRMCSARCSATAAHRCCPSVVFRFRSGSHRLLPHRPRGRIAHGHAPRHGARVRAGANLQRPACERVARDYRRAAHACAPDRSRHRRPHPARCASEPHGGEKYLWPRSSTAPVRLRSCCPRSARASRLMRLSRQSTACCSPAAIRTSSRITTAPRARPTRCTTPRATRPRCR